MHKAIEMSELRDETWNSSQGNHSWWISQYGIKQNHCQYCSFRFRNFITSHTPMSWYINYAIIYKEYSRFILNSTNFFRSSPIKTVAIASADSSQLKDFIVNLHGLSRSCVKWRNRPIWDKEVFKRIKILKGRIKTTEKCYA